MYLARVLQEKTRESEKHCKQRRKEANTICKQKKLWLNNSIMELGEANKRNETKTFFEELKFFKQQQAALPTNCKDSENNVVSQIEQVLKNRPFLQYS